MDVFAEEEFDTSLLTAARFSAPPGRIQRVGYVRDEHGCWTRVVVEYTRPMPAVLRPVRRGGCRPRERRFTRRTRRSTTSSGTDPGGDPEPSGSPAAAPIEVAA